MGKVDLSLIVAMTPQRVIGQGNDIPWRLPSDRRRTKKITTDIGTIIMGRKTWESLPEGGRPLPNRHHIILSRNAYLPVPQTGEVRVVASVDEALEVAASRGGRACVFGGKQIYEVFLPYVTMIYLTLVHSPTKILGDTYFPVTNPEDWKGVDAIRNQLQDPKDQYYTSFYRYVRARA